MSAAAAAEALLVLRLPLRQNHVDASAIHVNDSNAPTGPRNVISRLLDFMQLRRG